MGVRMMASLLDHVNEIEAHGNRSVELLERLMDAYDLLSELVNHKPTVISGRKPDPQDDVDDLMPVNEFEAFQDDAVKLLKLIDGVA